MKLAFYIARRYLVSKKSVNIINLISAISVVGVAVGTMALIVVLSAFNGIDFFIRDLLSSFDPDLKITVVEGKNFSPDEAGLAGLYQMEGIAAIMEVVEDNALLQYDDRQKYAVVKGVATNYNSFSGLDTMLTEGRFLLEQDDRPFTVIGQGVAYDLSVGLTFVDPVHIYYPKKENRNQLNMESALNHGYLFPTGIFSVQQEIDNMYILVPIRFARTVFEMEGRVTSLELKLTDGADIKQVKNQVKELLGERYLVQDRVEQHEFLYRVMRSEKWSSFLILSFILVIASFNLLGSLTMIIIDKKNDIHILGSMGANRRLIRMIFLFEGWLISISGAISGLILGVVLVWAQKNFELLKLPGDGSFAISAYPVQLQLVDVLATFLIVLGIGFLAAWYPVKSLANE
ncbi:ABC transporter permease [Gaoshiqia sp. Z1-71]|uniref:ABC transporter permease n=1 Tax=Gaoshiqia hydrogeniformans TaxID=3290090 RepID=UPI003BF79423